MGEQYIIFLIFFPGKMSENGMHVKDSENFDTAAHVPEVDRVSRVATKMHERNSGLRCLLPSLNILIFKLLMFLDLIHFPIGKTNSTGTYPLDLTARASREWVNCSGMYVLLASRS